MTGEVAGPKRILLSGDVEANLVKLYAQVDNQTKRVGKFDALLSVGAFLPGGGEGGKEAAAGFAEYVTSKREVPIETHFVETASAALIQSAPDGKTLCKNMHFLGGFGVREISGLQVAFLSGRYDSSVYASHIEGGPAFVGAAYTPQAVQGLKSAAEALGKAHIDVLLVGEWPTGLEDKLEEAERPKHPEGLALDLKGSCSPAVADLCATLGPRYLVCGTADIFYQRPPFQTPNHGHVCRCIALGKVRSKGKGRTWIHALALTPAAAMPEAALMQRPENTTPCPFLRPGVVEEGLAPPGVKRLASEMDDDIDEKAGEVPNEVFLAGLPENIDERGVQKALKHVGKIERMQLARDNDTEGRPCKGYGWVRFSTDEEAQAALELDGLLETGRGRKIRISISNPSKGKGAEGDGPKRREIKITVEPHAECWFCLVNPKVEKHMIVSASKDVYVATAKGPVNPLHVMVLPVKHAPCFARCPTDLQDRLLAYTAAVRSMYKAEGMECILYERWVPMGMSAANHMQIHMMPIEQRRVSDARDGLETVMKKQMPGAALKRISSHADVTEHQGSDPHTPYVYLELPGENTARGRQYERFVYVSAGRDGPRIPMNIGRMVACNILECESRMDWKQCTDDREMEQDLAAAFRGKFKAHIPKST